MQPLLSKATLLVVPNPFASPLDAVGRPHAFVAYDPEHLPKGTIRYIGATLERKVQKPRNVTALRASGQQQQYSRVTTIVRYNLAPTGIVDSAYHREQIRDGALLPADEATAKICGLESFVQPIEIIERSISERIADWCHEHPGEKIDPSAWTSGTSPQITGLAFAPRSPVVASTIEERITAQRAAQKLAEGDGLAAKAPTLMATTEARRSAGSTL